MRASRLGRLTGSQRALAQALSVHEGLIPHEACPSVFDGAPGLVYSALEGLLQEGLLIGSPHGYRFAHDDLRRQLESELSPVRRARAHVAFGERLVSKHRHDDPVRMVSDVEWLVAGIHLLKAGEIDRGAEAVVRGCTQMRGADSYVAAAPFLEDSLRLFRAAGKRRHELLVPLACLAIAGYFVERRLAIQYGPESLAVLEDCLGIKTMRGLRPYVGRRCAVLLGLLLATVGFAWRRDNAAVPAFRDALRLLFEAVATQTGVHAISVDPEAALRCARVLEPFTGLGRKHVAHLAYEHSLAIAMTVQDRQHASWTRWAELIERLRCDTIRGLDPDVRREFLAGGLYAWGVEDARRDAAKALLIADELEALNGKLFGMFADQIRTTYYAHRGKSQLADAAARRVEAHAIRNGSAWQAETWAAAASISVHMRTDDALGMKRNVEELQRLSRDLPSLRRLAQRAEGAYLLLREDPRAALAVLEADHERPLAVIGWLRLQASRARAYNALADHQRAREVCQAAMAHVTREDLVFTAFNLGIEIEHAMAEAGLGRTRPAAQQLHALFDLYAPNQNPLTLGALHEALARVALRAGDRAAYAEHARAMRSWYLPTATPALIRRCDNLSNEALKQQSDAGTEPLPGLAGKRGELTPEGWLLETRSIPECAERALSLVAQASGASEEGYLFLKRPEGPITLVARLGSQEPPQALRWWAQQCLDETSATTGLRTNLSEAPDESHTLLLGSKSYRLIALRERDRDVGAAVLAAEGSFLTPRSEIFGKVAHALSNVLRKSALASPRS
jgi:hypothetical protein